MTITIWERVKTALTPLGIPMAEGTYRVSGSAPIPDTYMIYFLPSIDPGIYLNDKEKYRPYLVQVSIYKLNTLIGLPDVIGAMVTDGFTFMGGREIEPGLTDDHKGIAFDFEYLEKL